MTDRAYPNVRLRLRRTSGAPGAPERTATMVFWLHGARFHLRDETGRAYSDFIADVAEPRGLGRASRTMEDLMDVWSATGRERAPTDVFADLSADRAVLIEEGGEPWTADAERTVGLADQVFTNGRESELPAAGKRRQLDRECTEYRLAIEGEEGGVPYRSDVIWLVSVPYLIRREVRDHPAGRMFAITELVELEEGAVTEEDLSPPAV